MAFYLTKWTTVSPSLPQYGPLRYPKTQPCQKYARRCVRKFQISFADTLKATAHVLTPKGSGYTLLFVVMSAHTLLGPFILMLRLVDQTVYMDQLYSCHNSIQSVYTCTAFCCCWCSHFTWSSFLYNLSLPTHTCGANTVLGSVVLLYIYTLSAVSVHSGTVYKTAVYTC
jgi:hypothetical protein